MRKIDEIDLALLRNLLAYDPETGHFTWRIRPYKTRVVVGSRAGSENPATHYRFLCIGGLRNCAEHQVAWLYHYGRPVPPLLDHINGDPRDNRIANLRPASPSQNNANRRRMGNNRSGFKGVDFNGGRWRALAKKNGKQHYFGLYDTAEEAHAAYAEGIKRLHGDFAKAN